MKKSVVIILMLFAIMPFAFANCNLDAKLINQDPYPAIPGDSVKIVFQLIGTSDPNCGQIIFEFKEQYPFELISGQNSKIVIESGTFVRDFNSNLIIPYKIRIDENAIEGENEVKIAYQSNANRENAQDFSIEESFNITIEDSIVDFEIHVKDYSKSEKKITFELLNIGESDVESVTIEIPEQENVVLRGPDRTIIGSIDSNEEDTATFDGEFKDGEINLIIYYTDQIGIRRKIERTILFKPENFPEENGNGGLSSGNAFIIGLLIPIIGYFIYNRIKKKKERERKHQIRKKHGL